jgi:hypothetical protein
MSRNESILACQNPGCRTYRYPGRAGFSGVSGYYGTSGYRPVGTGISVGFSGAVIDPRRLVGSVDCLETLPRRKIANLLEKAVMDGKIRDNVLFTFEAQWDCDGYTFTTEERDILLSYLKRDGYTLTSLPNTVNSVGKKNKRMLREV